MDRGTETPADLDPITTTATPLTISEVHVTLTTEEFKRREGKSLIWLSNIDMSVLPLAFHCTWLQTVTGRSTGPRSVASNGPKRRPSSGPAQPWKRSTSRLSRYGTIEPPRSPSDPVAFSILKLENAVRKLHPWERAQLMNLTPRRVEDAKSYVPSLHVWDDGELQELLDAMWAVIEGPANQEDFVAFKAA